MRAAWKVLQLKCTTNMELVRLNKVSKVLSGNEILQGVNIQLKKGEFVSLVGPSGCGKTTTLNILGAMDKVTSGEYFFNQKPIHNMNGFELAKFRANSIGFVFQSFNLLKRYSVYENVKLPFEYYNAETADMEERIDNVLEKVGLKDKKFEMVNKLSGGQSQRVAIARAIIRDPELLLADEPTGNLDSKSAEQIVTLLKELNQDGVTILLITHDEDIAKSTDRIIKMKDGAIL